MRKKMIKILSVTILAIMLTACGNPDSKVDQVIQNQMQEADNKNNQDDVINEIVPEEPTEIIELQLNVVEENISESVSENTAESISENISESVSENVADNLSNDGIDVDLTILSSTMVYSEVYNMMYLPEDYVGKTVRMRGVFLVYTNMDQSVFYPAVIIADATACCSQGLEFVLEGNPPYPEGYPEQETEITVVGTFETYYEDGYMYCRLKDARIE